MVFGEKKVKIDKKINVQFLNYQFIFIQDVPNTSHLAILINIWFPLAPTSESNTALVCLLVHKWCCPIFWRFKNFVVYTQCYTVWEKKAKVRNNAFKEDFIATVLNGWGFLWQLFTHVNFQAITFEARNLNTSEEWSKLYEHKLFLMQCEY